MSASEAHDEPCPARSPSILCVVCLAHECSCYHTSTLLSLQSLGRNHCLFFFPQLMPFYIYNLSNSGVILKHQFAGVGKLGKENVTFVSCKLMEAE